MESDERFKHLATDPRFKTLRKKQRKVQIDDRFQSMFTDEKFTLKYTKDKRGNNHKKTSGDDLKKYYHLEEKEPTKEPVEESESSEEVDGENEKSPEESPKESSAHLSKVSSEESSVEESEESSEESSEASSSSDESLSEDESDLEEEVDVNKIEYDWTPLDHDAQTAETTTRRLAIQNLDWDHLNVEDIYTLVHSIRPPISVKIYISEFGKERLKREEVEGPKELVEMPKVDEEEEEYNMLRDRMRALKNLEPKTYKVNEYEDADEALDLKNDEIRERIRAYQLNRMKYYYAVVEFDSVESAEVVYKELDGMEYEGSSLELDFRFIPDEVEFDDEDMKSICDKVPDLTNYAAPNFINTALQQTTAKFTWDETDVKRQEKLRKAHTKEELDRDDLEAYLGSETESDEEEAAFDDSMSVVTANSEARINKYKMLLKSLDEEAEKKKKVDIDVEWENDSGETDGGESDDGETEEEADDSDIDDSEQDVSDKIANDKNDKHDRKKKKPTSKSAKRRNKKLLKGDDDDEDDELGLLVMGENREEFQFNPEDERFKAIYESGRYNIDPSHPNFKRTKTFDIIAEKKREKRQKQSRS